MNPAAQERVNGVIDKIYSLQEVICSTEQSKEWILNSGSSSHATPDKDLIRVDSTKPNVTLMMANGSTSQVSAIGEVKIPLDGTELALNNVRYVPELDVNLVSFSRLVKTGFTYTQLNYSDQHSMLLESPNGTYSFKALITEQNILVIQPPAILENIIRYTLPTSPAEIDPAFVAQELLKPLPDPLLAQSNPSIHPIQRYTMDQWHRLLGHMNANNITRLARDPRLHMEVIGPKVLSRCDTCARAKMHHTPFNKRMTRCTKPAARIFIDLAGRGYTLFDKERVPTIGGATEIMLATDNASHLQWPYLLVSKAQATKYIKDFILMIEATTQHKIGILHVDGGGEFKSKELNNFCRARGIQFKITAAKSPQSNGVAERANRLVYKKTRALLIDAGLPEDLWGEALIAAIQIINTSPTSTRLYSCKGPDVKALTPIDAWSGFQPAAHWIHLWGCNAYPMDLHITRKFAERTLTPNHGNLWVIKDSTCSISTI